MFNFFGGFFNKFFASPEYLWIFFVLLILMLVLGFSSKRTFVGRLFVFLLLVFALAEPYSLDDFFGGGVAKLAVLEDGSESYGVFEKGVGEKIYETVRVSNVEFESVGDGVVSDIGDGMISKIKEDKNIVIVSDGRINSGVDFNEVVLEANKRNVSVSVVEPVLEQEDYFVKIGGPDKVSSGVESIFNVFVDGTEGFSKRVNLYLDGKEVKNGFLEGFDYSKKFDEGYHLLKAEITGEDFFSKNNVYYKVVKVVEKPKVLFYGEEDSSLYKVVNSIYDVDVVFSGLKNLDKYYAVIIDDKRISELGDDVRVLKDYVREGNGLVVVGGKNSFEYGNYEGSEFEKILPVKVSGVGKKEGDVNVVIVIDISGSTESAYGIGNTVDVEKSLAIGALEDISPEHNLGIVAFDSEYYIVEPIGNFGEKNLDNLKMKISQLSSGGSTEIGKGINGALDMIKGVGGAKNIILISDGNTQEKGKAYEAVERANKEFVKIYSISVGGNPDDAFLSYVASTSGGEMFKAIQSSKVEFLFGNPTKKRGEEFGIVIENENHFITEGIFLNGYVLGYNQVVPKNSAQLLVSGAGNPLVSVWREGVGRVGVISSDDGMWWGNDLYVGSSSSLIKRVLAWSVGDAERKEKYFVNVDDARVGEEFEIVVSGEDEPFFEDFEFEKVGEGKYVAKIVHDKEGFYELGDFKYEVNYNSEFENIGFNEDLRVLAVSTGGGIFNAENVVEDLEEYLKIKGDVLHRERDVFVWPFVLLALVIFLVDFWISRVREYKNI